MQEIQKINLSKLQKCDQEWENMIPNKNGRLCQKCSRTIIDFRQSSDQEIAHKHVFTEEPVCGIYHKKQLVIDKEAQPQKYWTQYLKAFSIGVAGLFSSLSLAGQTKEKPSTMVQVTPDYHKINGANHSQQRSHTINKEDTILVHGLVKDDLGDPLPGVIVLIKNTTNGINTDIYGRYLLDLTNVFDSLEEVTLVYMTVGFENQEITIKKNELFNENKKEFNVQLVPESLVDFIVYAKEKWHKRTWRKIKNVFRKKDKAKK